MVELHDELHAPSSVLRSLLDEVSKQFETEYGELRKRQAALAVAQEQFEVESKAMSKLGITEDDVLELNVGGEVMAVKRGTLLQAPEDSMMAALFSGRWDNAASRDSEGRLFLDFSPSVFKKILSYLRALRLAPPRKRVPAPIPEKFEEQEFRFVVEYLGLTEFLFGEHATVDLKLGSGSASIQIEKDGRFVRNGSKTPGHLPIVGELQLPEGPVCWKAEVRSMLNDDWIFIGIIANRHPDEDSYSDPTAQGWAGSPERIPNLVYINGINQHGHGGWVGWKAGDVAIMGLDEDHLVLTMYHLRLRQRFQICDLCENRSWRLHMNLHGPGDSVEISHASKQEALLLV